MLARFAAVLLFAQTARALVIDPLRTELHAEPGSSLSGSIELTNERAHPVRLSVHFRDLSPAANADSAWIEVDQSAQTITPGETVAVAYVVTLPADACGEFIGRVGFVEEKGESRGAVPIRTKISVPIYVIVAGTETYTGTIENIRWMRTDPAKVEVLVRNDGNAHLRARGTCVIIDTDSGDTRDEFTINEQGFPIYPGRISRVLGQPTTDLGPGTYTVTVTMPFPDEHQVLSKSIQLNVPEDQP